MSRNSYWKYSEKVWWKIFSIPLPQFHRPQQQDHEPSVYPQHYQKGDIYCKLGIFWICLEPQKLCWTPQKKWSCFYYFLHLSLCLTSNRKFLETSQRMAGLVRVPDPSCRHQSLGTFEVRVLEAPALPLSTKLPIIKPEKFPSLFISRDPEWREVMQKLQGLPQPTLHMVCMRKCRKCLSSILKLAVEWGPLLKPWDQTITCFLFRTYPLNK